MGVEDYELLFSAPASVPVPRSLAGVPVTLIGRLKRRRKGASQVTLIRGNGLNQPLASAGWEHFKQTSKKRPSAAKS